MTTLAANTIRAFELGEHNNIPVIASDIIYQGAAVGVVAGTGHARPLTAGDKFAGFAYAKADNSAGSAAAIDVDVVECGEVQLSVSGAVITDIGQPVYATDDDTFVFLPTGASFIGFVKRFVSSGVVIVSFDADSYQDPYGPYVGRETLAAATLTLDIQDNGKTFFVTVDSVITLPAVATPVNCKVVCMGPYGTVQISLSPNASDKIQGIDMGGTDDHDLVNTKATARRGDYAILLTGDANGALIGGLKGTWVTA